MIDGQHRLNAIVSGSAPLSALQELRSKQFLATNELLRGVFDPTRFTTNYDNLLRFDFRETPELNPANELARFTASTVLSTTSDLYKSLQSILASRINLALVESLQPISSVARDVLSSTALSAGLISEDLLALTRWSTTKTIDWELSETLRGVSDVGSAYSAYASELVNQATQRQLQTTMQFPGLRFADMSLPGRSASAAVGATTALIVTREADVADPDRLQRVRRDQELEDALGAISPDLRKAWVGAWTAALQPAPDHHRHAMVSTRALLERLLLALVDEGDLSDAEAATVSLQPAGKRSVRVRHLTAVLGPRGSGLAEAIERQMTHLYGLLSQNIHGRTSDEGFEHDATLATLDAAAALVRLLLACHRARYESDI